MLNGMKSLRENKIVNILYREQKISYYYVTQGIVSKSQILLNWCNVFLETVLLGFLTTTMFVFFCANIKFSLRVMD